MESDVSSNNVGDTLKPSPASSRQESDISVGGIPRTSRLSALFQSTPDTSPDATAILCSDSGSELEQKSPSGTMVLVKKKDLQALKARLADMEIALSELQVEHQVSAAMAHVTDGEEDEGDEKTAVWISPSEDIDSITGLSGWLVMTAIGAGIVAAEVIMNKVRTFNKPK